MWTKKLLFAALFCFAALFFYSNAGDALSREDALKRFCSPIKRRKLSGSNIHHLKFKHFNKKQNLEDCASMTVKLNGKSFDFWAFGCYINVGDASDGYLRRSVRYSYYQLSDGSADACSSTGYLRRMKKLHKPGNTGNAVNVAPQYGYPLVCKKRTRRADSEECAPPPYPYPPTYFEAVLPNYGSLYESYEEADKIAELLKNKKSEVFHSIYFETLNFDCDCTISSPFVVLNCVDPRKPGSKPSSEYNCLLSKFQGGVAKFKVFGDDIDTGKKVLEEYTFHSPPDFCPPPNALMDYHDDIVQATTYLTSEASGRVMVPLLLHQEEGRPNVLLSTAVHHALLMRDKQNFYFRDDYFTIWHDSGYMPIDYNAGYKAGDGCDKLSKASIKKDIFSTIDGSNGLAQKYEDLFEDLPKRDMGMTVEDYLIALRKERLPGIAYEFVAFLITEKHPLKQALEKCDSYDHGFQKSFTKYDRIAETIAKRLQLIETYEDSTDVFEGFKCQYIVNFENEIVARRLKLNCEDPSTPGAGVSHDYNCMYSSYEGLAVVNLMGSAPTSMADSMGEKLIQKYKNEGQTLPNLCPPMEKLLKLHEAIATKLKLTDSLMRDSSVRNIITGRTTSQSNVVMEYNLYNILFSFGRHMFASETYGYKEIDNLNNEIKKACEEVATFQLSGLFYQFTIEELHQSKYSFLYDDMNKRGYFSYLSTYLSGTNLRTYVNILKHEYEPLAIIDFFEFIRNTDSELIPLLDKCESGGMMYKPVKLRYDILL